MFAGTAKDPKDPLHIFVFFMIPSSTSMFHVCASLQVLQSTGSPLVNSQLFFLDLNLSDEHVCDVRMLVYRLTGYTVVLFKLR